MAVPNRGKLLLVQVRIIGAIVQQLLSHCFVIMVNIHCESKNSTLHSLAHNFAKFWLILEITFLADDITKQWGSFSRVCSYDTDYL